MEIFDAIKRTLEAFNVKLRREPSSSVMHDNLVVVVRCSAKELVSAVVVKDEYGSYIKKPTLKVRFVQEWDGSPLPMLNRHFKETFQEPPK